MNTEMVIPELRAGLNPKGELINLAETKWWNREDNLFRIYLICRCWDRKGEVFLPSNIRKEMASREWKNIPPKLRAGIVNEMGRLNLAYKVMRGK